MSRFVLNLTFALSLLSACDAKAIDLVLKETCIAEAGIIRLGDIADIYDTTAEMTDDLERLPLMPAPAPGTEAFIRAASVRDLLVATGVKLESLRFDGAITVKVSSVPREETPRTTEPQETAPEPVVIPETKNEAAAAPAHRQRTGYRFLEPITHRGSTSARRALSASRLRSLEDELHAELTKYASQQLNDSLIQVADGELLMRHAELLEQAQSSLQFDITTPLGAGRQRFLISFETADGEVRFPFFADVLRGQPVVTVIRSLRRGDLVTAADVELRPMEKSMKIPRNESVFTTIEEVLGQEASRSLRSGDVLTDRRCMQPIMVNRGQLVTVTASASGFRVKMQATARKAGRLGEMLEVETLDDQERLLARVVGRGELAILSASPSRATASPVPNGFDTARSNTSVKERVQ